MFRVPSSPVIRIKSWSIYILVDMASVTKWIGPCNFLEVFCQNLLEDFWQNTSRKSISFWKIFQLSNLRLRKIYWVNVIKLVLSPREDKISLPTSNLAPLITLSLWFSSSMHLIFSISTEFITSFPERILHWVHLGWPECFAISDKINWFNSFKETTYN